MCCLDYTCDRTDTKVRFYDGVQNKWCPWTNIDGYVLYGGCFFWNFDREEDVTPFFGPDADSMMFAWDLLDRSTPANFCRGKHKQTDNIIDNISIGFFDGNATVFRVRGIDLLQDTFHDSVPAYNSSFDSYSLDTLGWYSGPPYTNPIRKTNQLYLDVSDKDLVREVLLIGSIDGGATWSEIQMEQFIAFDPTNPDLGGEYYGTLYPTDFPPQTRWDKGTEVWYYVRCEDQDGTPGNYAYFPGDADPADPEHTGGREDYFTFSIMPMFPITYTGVKILLVDGFGRRTHDWSPCLEDLNVLRSLEDIYEETLVDAGYCYDKYDISGAGSNVHQHPLQYTDYDAVIWFTGPYFSNYLFDKEAQIALRDYLAGGGKVILCGDRIAYNMYEVGEDSLGGEFLSGIMGATYQAEMESPFSYPYVYLDAVPSVNVLGSPVTLTLDTLLLYRECPELKDMTYVVTNTSPPAGYTAQSVMYLLNPDPAYDPADGIIYVEYLGTGQCVYINFDLSACVNHTRTSCPAIPPGGSPRFPHATLGNGTSEGRVEVMKEVLEEILNLPAGGTGHGGTASVDEPVTHYSWALGQNVPNPCLVSTAIRYEVARRTHVRLRLFNALGQVVRVLQDGPKPPGIHEARWDGRNDSGERVSSGVYFYKMEAGKYTATRKMLLIN
jgi:hypothetical protein